MKMRLILLMIGVAVPLFAFQNCSKAKFSPSDASSGLVHKADADGDNHETLVPIAADDDEDVSDDRAPCDKHPDKNDRNEHAKSDDADAPDADGAELVACILDGPGKSVKLGLLAEDLGGVNAVSQSVCVSRNDCLNEVSKRFKVLEAASRGYCKNNPNVRRLSSDELKALLNQ
jgi:hypothetical protein